VSPFHLHYSLSRRQRLATEIYPWLPALAGSFGFCIGAIYLSVVVTPWFLMLFVVPVVVYSGLFGFLFDIAVRPGQAVEIIVDKTQLVVRVDDEERRELPLDGIIQVFRSEDRSTWTVLHLDGSVILIPAEAISEEQLEYLKEFARRALARRRAARTELS
jgi:hypothetical protein